MEAFGDLEDNAPDGGLHGDQSFEEQNAWAESSLTPEVPDSQQDVSEGSGLNQPSSSSEAASGDARDAAAPATGTVSGNRERTRRQRLTVKVTRIENTKQDAIIWFDVNTTLPRFRTQSFKDVRRTHHELKKFANHLASANPECFVPALPPATSSWPVQSPQHDTQIVANIQRWFDRVTRSPLLIRDEEFLYFVQSSFGYSPVVKIKPPATGLARKLIKQLAPPPDDVDELREFRPVAKLVYQYATESQSRLQIVSRCRHSLSGALAEFAKSLDNLGESNLAKCVDRTSESDRLKSILEEATYGDTLSLVAADAFVIKETLTNRHILMRDLNKAQSESRAKHQNAVRVKGATNISQGRVDEAINQLEDATQLERRITSAVRRVTDNLVVEKAISLSRMESDLLSQIQQLALRTIDTERRTLSAWESLRPEIRSQAVDGGLSRLGRPDLASPTGPRKNRRSQTLFGDDWSGDRYVRAKDIAPPPEASNEVVDARTAVSMLSESIF